MKDIVAGVSSALRRYRIKRLICNQGGRISGNVKLTVGENATLKFGKALYLNGSGITAAKRMQIIVSGGGNFALETMWEYLLLQFTV